MSFPNYSDKHGKPSLLNPDEMLAFRRRLGHLTNIQPPEALIVCLQRGLPERRRMRWKHPIRHVGKLMADLYVLKRTRGRVAVLTNLGEGSPMIVSLTEELIAFGVKRIISLTFGGGLQPDLQPGDIVVCDRAIRDEGTSHHYLPSEKYVYANPLLVEQLKNAIEARGRSCQIGTTWTTDAPFRETREEVTRYQAEGVKTVEMEIAGLFALGQFRNVQVTSAIAIGDSLAQLHWQIPSNLRPIESSLELIYAAAIDVLSKA
ncbi:MAG: nucleoside phosphorylase [Anaerolineales bacterium]